MKKQILLFFLILVPIFASADAVEIDGIFYNLIPKGKVAEVTKKSSGYYKGNVVIPESVTYENVEYIVSAIGKSAFSGSSSLTSVTIPNSVTSIAESAFSGCSKLTSVHIIELEAWCKIAFNNSTSNPLFYAHHLYLNGEEITDLEIPNSVTNIGNYVFSGCSCLVSVNIPNSVTTIGKNAFSDCSGLTSVTIPNTITNIEGYAFSGCSSLASVTIPNLVTRIEGYAFSGCSGLTSVTIPHSVTSIGYSAFSGCSGLTSVTIPNCVTSIERGAFNNCSSLTSVTIPNSVTSIGEGAFKDCSGLTSVNITDLDAWCKISFSAIRTHDSNPLFYAHHLLLNGEEIKDLVIPNSVKRIGINSFYGCSGLTSVIIPNSVTSIGDYAFENCNGLTSVSFGNSVSNIGEWTFSGCSGLTSVVIPNSVTSIGRAAFENCSSLTSATISNSVKGIKDYTFDGCSSLITVTIGSGVEYINGGVHSPELTDVFCLAEIVPATLSKAFSGSYIEYATLHVPANSVEAYKSTAPWSNFGTIVAIEVPKHTLAYTVDGTTYKTYTIEEGETVSTEAEPTKEGYTFSGWSEIPSTMPDHDVTVTGTFTINKYKLIYKLDGTNYKTYDVAYNSAITPEEAPTKDGYTFSGWSEIPETMPANDITITGSFIANKYKLTYLVDGAEYKTAEVDCGETIVPEESPTKEGYTFSGWSEIPSTMPANDVTVTGTFTVNKYTITYIIDGEVFKSMEVEYNSVITPPDAPAQEGYDFAWADVPETMPASDITIYGTYTTGISSLNVEESDRQVFTPDGKRVETPKKGLNIIRMSDGTVKKIVVK